VAASRPVAPGGPGSGPPGVLPVDLGPGVRAGFTLRGEDGAHANLGLGVGDDRARVLAARGALTWWTGGPVAWSTQVHGTAVAVVTGARPADGEPVGEADALVADPGVGVAVVVADCVPVLLADPGSGVVSAVHAGRRGLTDGVVQAAVAAMTDRGARADRVRAAIGPAICGRCYEVPADLQAEVADVVPGVASRTSWGTPALDLPAGVVAVLRGLGVEQVHTTGLCTHTDERFFSHRRSVRTGEPQGRCAGVVRGVAP
jgi:polyphenol oxidase